MTAPSLETWTRLKRIAQHYADSTGWYPIRNIDYWYRLSSNEAVNSEVLFEDGHISSGNAAAIEYLLQMCHAAGIPEPSGEDNTNNAHDELQGDAQNTDRHTMTIQTE
jgi:hypothetical protein